MLADRIRQVLARRPYWGAQTVAKVLDTTARSVRVTASREGIKLMDRYEVETFVDALVDKVETLEAPGSGEAQ